MSVYVDDAFILWRSKRWCHLTADSTEELHAFAAELGLRREWFQPGSTPSRDHYDVSTSKRQQAIALGAISETTDEGAARRRALHVRH